MENLLRWVLVFFGGGGEITSSKKNCQLKNPLPFSHKKKLICVKTFDSFIYCKGIRDGKIIDGLNKGLFITFQATCSIIVILSYLWFYKITKILLKHVNKSENENKKAMGGAELDDVDGHNDTASIEIRAQNLEE